MRRTRGAFFEHQEPASKDHEPGTDTIHPTPCHANDDKGEASQAACWSLLRIAGVWSFSSLRKEIDRITQLFPTCGRYTGMNHSPLSDRTQCAFPVVLRQAMNDARERAAVLSTISTYLRDAGRDHELQKLTMRASTELLDTLVEVIHLWRTGLVATPFAVRAIDDAREASRAIHRAS